MGKNRSNSAWAIVLFCIGVLIAALDNGIISAALTTINSSFGVSANWGAWGVTIYTLGLAIILGILKLKKRKSLLLVSSIYLVQFYYLLLFLESCMG